MDFIFLYLPAYLIPFGVLLKKTGFRVWYLNLSGFSEDTNDNLIRRLQSSGIYPLEIESLPLISGFTEGHADPGMRIFHQARQYAPVEFVEKFRPVYPNIPDFPKKIQTIVHSDLVKMAYVTNRVNIWARANQDRKCLLIDVTLSGLFMPGLERNAKLLVIPVDIIAKGIGRVITGIKRAGVIFRGRNHVPQKKDDSQKNTHNQESRHCRAAFVPHQGLSFGKLFNKDLFYSDREDSALHPQNMVHLDYSGFPSPSPDLKWDHIGNHRRSLIKNIYHSLVAIRYGILNVRSLKQILGLITIARSYVVYRSYLNYLEKYPSLKFALIDYEILCPKELLLAFESKGIVTVAAQERFTQSNGKLMGSILSYYLCSSPFAENLMRKSPTYCVDTYVPVGQYRSDILVQAQTEPLPKVLVDPVAKGYKIITALGFHTVLNSHESQVDPLCNWTAHKHFLDDMWRLSNELPNVFIILRYKDVDWIKLSRFKESVDRIMSSENITISVDYDKPFMSNKLCARSDLVIAKPTSLADECLSVGIPVLFHSYSHNFRDIVSDAFDYSPTRVVCYNHAELLERARTVLQGTPNEMSSDYTYLKDTVYGGLGEGRVRERIHTFIEKLVN